VKSHRRAQSVRRAIDPDEFAVNLPGGPLPLRELPPITVEREIGAGLQALAVIEYPIGDHMVRLTVDERDAREVITGLARAFGRDLLLEALSNVSTLSHFGGATRSRS
jgi:hypothetical protein